MEKIILFVDNDIFTAKLFSKLLGTLYTLVIRKTADDAIKDLDMGLKPNIVISSRVLKGTDGIKFLKRIDKDHPKCFKILITAENNPKLLIQYISDSKADLFLTKPFNSLQLIQILKLGLFKYAEKSDNENVETSKENNQNKNSSDLIKKIQNESVLSDKSSTFKELKILESKYNQEVEKNNSVYSEYQILLIKGISNTISDAENFYFRNHTVEVVEICRSISMRLNFSEEEQKNILYASLLHNFYLLNLPDLFKVSFISELDDEMKIDFFNHFNNTKNYFYQIKSLCKYLDYASMIFEHVDGSGEPNKLSGLLIPKEIQLLIMINLYHNLVYRVRKEDILRLKLEGELIQSKTETIKRHQNAITYFFKNIKWFDHDLFYKFQDFIKKREINGLRFNEKDLKVYYNNEKYLNLSSDEKIIKKYLVNKNTSDIKKVVVLNQNEDVIEEYLEERLNISELKAGDITTKEIVTYDGLQITPEKFEQTESSLEKINNRLSEKNISEIVFVKREIKK